VPSDVPVSSTTARRVAGWVAVGTAAVVAIPIVQGAHLGLTGRPAVPGPHDQDGMIPSTGGTDEPLNLVWLGDSLASGIGAATPDGAFPRKAAALFCADHDRSVSLTCLARGGACADDVLVHQVPQAVGLLGPTSVVVVTVGSNDVGGLTHPRRFHRDYDAILTALTATGATVIAVGLPDIGSAKVVRQPLRTLARLAGRHADAVIRRLAHRHGAHFVGIDLRAGRTKPAAYLAADRYHPNDETYALWAGRVAALLTVVAATSSLGPGPAGDQRASGAALPAT
jgi:lysophospholipase L1-like esterase